MIFETTIKHITKPGANIFLELGFEQSEAATLHTESQQQISNTKALKEQLIEELSKWILENHLKETDVSSVLKVSRPQVSDVINKKVSKFTIDALVDMLFRVGKPVRFAVG